MSMRLSPIFLVSLWLCSGSHALADPEAPKTEAPKTETSDAQAKALHSAGYKPETRNGKTVYCRHEPQLGTHFESKVCGTPEEIARSIQNSKDATADIQRRATVPVKAIN
jgi:hypothetical protein